MASSKDWLNIRMGDWRFIENRIRIVPRNSGVKGFGVGHEHIGLDLVLGIPQRM